MTKHLTAEEIAAAREGREVDALESARRRMPIEEAFRLVAEARG